TLLALEVTLSNAPSRPSALPAPAVPTVGQRTPDFASTSDQAPRRGSISTRNAGQTSRAGSASATTAGASAETRSRQHMMLLLTPCGAAPRGTWPVPSSECGVGTTLGTTSRAIIAPRPIDHRSRLLPAQGTIATESRNHPCSNCLAPARTPGF